VRADTVRLLLLCGACSRCVGLLPSPALAGAAAADTRCLVRNSTLRAVTVFFLSALRAPRRSTGPPVFHCAGTSLPCPLQPIGCNIDAGWGGGGRVDRCGQGNEQRSSWCA
jgi:hypothetical protein